MTTMTGSGPTRKSGVHWTFFTDEEKREKHPKCVHCREDAKSMASCSNEYAEIRKECCDKATCQLYIGRQIQIEFRLATRAKMVQRRREFGGWSVEDLAKRTGLSVAQIEAIEDPEKDCPEQDYLRVATELDLYEAA